MPGSLDSSPPAGMMRPPIPPFPDLPYGPAHAAPRRPRPRRRADGRVRRLGHARAVRGNPGRARRGPGAGRPVRRLPHGRGRLPRAQGARVPPAPLHERPLPLPGRPGAVRRPVPRERRDRRRRRGLPPLGRGSARLRQRLEPPEGLRLAARARLRRRGHERVGRLGAARAAGAARARDPSAADERPPLQRRHLSLHRWRGGRGPLPRRPDRLHGRGWLRALLRRGGRATPVGVPHRGGPPGRPPPMRARRARLAAARDGPGLGGEARQGCLHGPRRAPEAEGGRPLPQAGRLRAHRAWHLAPRPRRPAGRQTSRHRDERHPLPEPGPLDRPRLRPASAGGGGLHVRSGHPRPGGRRQGREDPFLREKDPRLNPRRPPMNYPDDLKYTKEHEWCRVKGNRVVVGITDHAQDSLGDIVYVELPEVGDPVKKGEAFGVVESTKAVSELFSPVTGKVVEVNDPLSDAPETINEDPYEEGWMIQVEVADFKELDTLLDTAAYQKFIQDESE